MNLTRHQWIYLHTEIIDIDKLIYYLSMLY